MTTSSFFATATLLLASSSFSSCNAQVFTAAPVTSAPDTSDGITTFTGAPNTLPPVTNPPVFQPVFAPVPALGAPTQAETILYNEKQIPIPRFRFVLWEDYDNKELAEKLGYTAENWGIASPNGNPLETTSFRGLDENVQTDVLAMGFTEDSWNCWMNHYTGFPWPPLERVGAMKDWEALGYTQLIWNGTIPGIPDEANNYWDKLSPEAKQAATNLCYLPQTWNQIYSFSDWLSVSAYLASTEPFTESSSPVLPSTSSPTAPPTSSPTAPPTAPRSEASPTAETSDGYSIGDNKFIIAGLLMVVSNFFIMK